MIIMENQNYCMVNNQTNVCDNVTVWDGDTSTWTPPANYLMLAQATTPAKVWVWSTTDDAWALGVQEGAGSIGFTWDGEFLITADPMPPKPVQPVVDGAQTL